MRNILEDEATKDAMERAKKMSEKVDEMSREMLKAFFTKELPDVEISEEQLKMIIGICQMNVMMGILMGR